MISSGLLTVKANLAKIHLKPYWKFYLPQAIRKHDMSNIAYRCRLTNITSYKGQAITWTNARLLWIEPQEQILVNTNYIT